MRTLFVNPPFLGRFSRSQRSPGVIKSGTMYYPYWLAQAAALLEERGHEIHLLDCPAAGLGEAELHRAALDFAPGLVVMESVTASWRSDLAVAAGLKRLLPETAVCLVGTQVTALWRETLESEPAVDFAAIGEFDFTVLELAEELEQEEADFGRVLGLAYRKAGQPERTAERPLISDLDELPWIAPIYKRFLNPHDYFFSLSHQPMVMLIGGRGCNARCFFCVYPQTLHGHRYRHRSPQHLVGEILWVQENMPEVREITLEDDNFGADRSFALEFARLARERGVRLPFFANLRTNVDFEPLKALREAGLRCCAVGFESGDDLLLKNMRKGQTGKTQKRFVENAKKLGLLVHGCFMVGFPGETRQTMRKTLQLALEIKPDSAQFYPVIPYPGTSAYEYYRARGYLAVEDFREWLTPEGGHRCVLNLPGLPAEEIESFCEQAYRKFHFRPRFLLYKLGQAFRDPGEGWRSLKAGLNFFRYALANRRRGQRPTSGEGAPPPADWYGRVKVPPGRMEKIRRAERPGGPEA